MIKYLIVFAILALVLPAQAAVLWDQPTTPTAYSVTSQEFSDAPTWSSRAFDDFTAGAGGWTASKVTVYGYEWGSGGTPKLAFTTSANYTAIGTTYSGTEVGADFIFDLPDVYIGPGHLWMTSWVERPLGSFSDPKQWFWDYIPTVNGTEAYWHNPGNGFGYGADPMPLQNIVGLPGAVDMAFKIEGRLGGQPAVPEAGSLVLAISGIPALAFFIRRRK